MVQGGFADEGAVAVASEPIAPEVADAALAQLLASIRSVVSHRPMQLIQGVDARAAQHVQTDALNTYIERENISARYLLDRIGDVRAHVNGHFASQLDREMAAASEAHLAPIVERVAEAGMRAVQGQLGGNDRDAVLNRVTQAASSYLLWVRSIIKQALIINGNLELPTNIVFELETGVDGEYESGVNTFISWGGSAARNGLTRSQSMTLMVPWISRSVLANNQGGIDDAVIYERRRVFERALILAILNKTVRRT